MNVIQGVPVAEYNHGLLYPLEGKDVLLKISDGLGRSTELGELVADICEIADLLHQQRI